MLISLVEVGVYEFVSIHEIDKNNSILINDEDKFH